MESILHTPLLVEPDFADEIIKACCILHNYIHQRDGASYEDNMESNLLVDDLEIAIHQHNLITIYQHCMRNTGPCGRLK